jgi:hypothetical protein
MVVELESPWNVALEKQGKLVFATRDAIQTMKVSVLSVGEIALAVPLHAEPSASLKENPAAERSWIWPKMPPQVSLKPMKETLKLLLMLSSSLGALSILNVLNDTIFTYLISSQIFTPRKRIVEPITNYN